MNKKNCTLLFFLLGCCVMQSQELQWALRTNVSASGFHEGRSVFYSNNKCGVIDITGKIIVPANWEYIADFENGNAILRSNADTYGLIGRDGCLIIPAIYDFMSRINEDYFYAKKDNKCGVLNSQGEIVLPVEYDFIFDETIDIDVVKINRNDKYGLTDGNFNIILPVEYESIASFKDKEFPIIEIRKNGKKYGFNLMTKHICTPAFEHLFAKGSDFADITLETGETYVIDKWGKKLPKHINQETGVYAYKENGKWGFKDKTGKVLISPRYDYVGDYWYYSFISVSKDYKSGIVNNQGKEILAPKKDCILHSFYCNYDFAVIMHDDKIGAIDINGREVIPLKYEHVTRVPRFNGVFEIDTKDGKTGWVNVITGNTVKPEYEWGFPIASEYIETHKDDLYGILRLPDCKILAEAKYRDIKYEDGYFRVQGKISEYGWIDAEGNEIVPPIYSHLDPPSEGLIYAERYTTPERDKKEWVLYDIKGNIVLDASCGIDLKQGFSEGVAFASRKRQGKTEYGFIYNTLSRSIEEIAVLGYKSPIAIQGTMAHASTAIRPEYDPNKAISPESYFHYGLDELKKPERTDEALQYFNKALELDPDMVGAWINKGVCHYRKGAYRKAVRAYKRALELDPGNEQARSNLAAAQSARSQRNWAIVGAVSGALVQTLNTAAAICNTANPAVSSTPAQSKANYKSATSRGKKICSLCNGTGKNPAKERPAFYDYTEEDYSSGQCEICGSSSNHWHKDCPSCGGTGYQ